MIAELTHIMLDPAHWIAENIMGGTLTLLAAYPIRRLVARHDRRKHTPEGH